MGSGWEEEGDNGASKSEEDHKGRHSGSGGGDPHGRHSEFHMLNI